MTRKAVQEDDDDEGDEDDCDEMDPDRPAAKMNRMGISEVRDNTTKLTSL